MGDGVGFGVVVEDGMLMDMHSSMVDVTFSNRMKAGWIPRLQKKSMPSSYAWVMDPAVLSLVGMKWMPFHLWNKKYEYIYIYKYPSRRATRISL